MKNERNIDPHYIECEQSLGEDDLQYLREIKQDFFDLVEKVKMHTELTPEEYADFVWEQEDTLDDYLRPAWEKAQNRAGYGVNYLPLPVSQETQKYRDECNRKLQVRIMEAKERENAHTN